MSKKIYEEKETVIDEYGEVKQFTNKIIRRTKPDEFIAVYLNDISPIMGITSSTQMKILVILWRDSAFNQQDSANGNLIYLVKARKKEISEEIKVNIRTVDNAIYDLVSKELLIKKDRSVYWLNPKYFFKGYHTDHTKVIRTVLEYRITDNPEQEEINFDNVESKFNGSIENKNG